MTVHSSEIKRIREEIRSLKRRTPSRPRTIDELDKAIQEIDEQMVSSFVVEQSVFHDDGNPHFLDELGLTAREFVEMKSIILEKKLVLGIDLDAEIEKSGLGIDGHFLELVKDKLRRRGLYHPRKNGAKIKAWLENMQGIKGEASEAVRG